MDKNTGLSASNNSLKLQKTNGKLNTINLFFGIVIGSGIFISLQSTATLLPNSGITIIMWITMGVYSMLGSFCFAELGTCFPKTGGDFLYLKLLMPKSIGDLVAFLRIFVEVLVVRPGIHAAIALTVSEYLIVPFAQTWGEDLKLIIRIFTGILLIIILTLINAYSPKMTAYLTNGLSSLKVVLLIGISLLGIVQMCRGNFVGLQVSATQQSNVTANITANVTDHNRPDESLWAYDSTWQAYSMFTIIGKFATATFRCQYSFAGWSDINYAIEEIIEPSKNYPIASMVSMSIITVLYTSIIVGVYSMLSHGQIIHPKAIKATVTVFVQRSFGYTNGEGSMAFLITAIMAILVY